MSKKLTVAFLGLCFIALGLNSCGFGVPVVGQFGSTFPVTTDTATNQLISYYDLRDRESFVQVSNVTSSDVAIHVQIFQNNIDGCPELNFYDTLTPNDTHIYNMRDLVGNALPVNINLGDDSNGFVVATLVESTTPGSESVLASSLIGNFRIVDNTGYEYRSNSAGFPSGIFERFAEIFQIFADNGIIIGDDDDDELSEEEEEAFLLEIIDLLQRAQPRYTFNFSETGGNNQSDIVGIAIANAGAVFNIEGGDGDGDGDAEIVSEGFPSVINIPANFVTNIYNNAENPTSCDDIVFTCGGDNPFFGGDGDGDFGFDIIEGDLLNQGINNIFPNTNGENLLCPGNTTTEGFVELLGTSPGQFAFGGFFGDGAGPSIFAGFVGLNNGNGRGSMDSMVGNNVDICPFLFPDDVVDFEDTDGPGDDIVDNLALGVCDPFGFGIAEEIRDFIDEGPGFPVGPIGPGILSTIENLGINIDNLIIETE